MFRNWKDVALVLLGAAIGFGLTQLLLSFV